MNHYKQNLTFGSQMFIIILFIILFSVLFSLASGIYNNYQYDLKIKQFEAENERYRQENKVKLYEYLRSNLKLVLEKEKKETMNEINPGEQVIVLQSENSPNNLFVHKPQKSKQDTKEERYKNESNPQKWWYFFFD